MDKRFLLLSVLGIFIILALTSVVSACSYPGCGGYYGYDHGYGYVDTYYKQKTYTPFGQTVVIQKDTPYKSHYSKTTTYNYGYDYGGYGRYGGYYNYYPSNALYRYFKYPTSYAYSYPTYYGSGYGGCYGYYC